MELLLKYVDGLELFSSYHSEIDCVKYLNLAKMYNLIITCGSDYHGMHKSNIQIMKISCKDIEKYENNNFD